MKNRTMKNRKETQPNDVHEIVGLGRAVDPMHEPDRRAFYGPAFRRQSLLRDLARVDAMFTRQRTEEARQRAKQEAEDERLRVEREAWAVQEAEMEVKRDEHIKRVLDEAQRTGKEVADVRYQHITADIKATVASRDADIEAQFERMAIAEAQKAQKERA